MGTQMTYPLAKKISIKWDLEGKELRAYDRRLDEQPIYETLEMVL